MKRSERLTSTSVAYIIFPWACCGSGGHGLGRKRWLLLLQLQLLAPHQVKDVLLLDPHLVLEQQKVQQSAVVLVGEVVLDHLLPVSQQNQKVAAGLGR
jgi:hypothetical protein